MPEFRTISNEARDGIPTPQTPAGYDLGKAITALRRSAAVLIRDEKLSVLAIAAELVTEENLRRLREVSPSSPRVVLTRRRAVALGLAPREELSGAVTISVSPEMPAAVIRNLADPGASLGVEPPGLVLSRSLLKAVPWPRSPWRSLLRCCRRRWLFGSARPRPSY